MPTFRFIARGSAGEENAGSLEAYTAIDAMNQLRRRGLRVERLENEDEPFAIGPSAEPEASADAANRDGETPSAPKSADGRLGTEEFAEIAGRIAGITKAQLPLLPGLRALSEGFPSRSLRRGLRALCLRLERGQSLEEALQAGAASLPKHLSGLIVVGVQSGRLGEMMDWFLHHVRRQADLTRRCRASLFYPAVLLTAGLGALVFGLLFIIPALRQVYTEMGVELPDLTQAVLALSDLVRNDGLGLLGAVLLVLGGVPLLLWSLGGRPLLDRSLAATPFVGTMFRCAALAGFCELLSMFIAARLPFSQAVRWAGDGCRDADLREQFDAIAECLEQGQDDAAIFGRLANISPQLIHVFHWRSREENFLESLRAAVRIYENQARMQVTVAGMLLEPIVIVGVLTGVGTFVAASFLPLIKLLNSLS